MTNVKTLLLAEGITVTPTTNTTSVAGSYVAYASDAAFVSAKGSAAANGDVYYNTTTALVRYYSNGAWSAMVDDDSTQTMTNKRLNSPKLNEDVVLASTATELNQLDGVSVGGSSSGDIATIDGTQTMTNKRLTSPKINEDVALSSTATELNQLDGVSVGGTSTGDIATIDGTQILTAKDFAGGTASDTSRLTIPKNTIANLGGLTRKQATLLYASDEDKAYLDNGSSLLPLGGGGGISTVYLDHTDDGANLADGFRYIIDMSGASAKIDVNAPSGTTGYYLEVAVTGTEDQAAYASTPYYVDVLKNGSDAFRLDGKDYTTGITIGQASDYVSFAWDTGSPWWVVTPFTAFVARTLEGPWVFNDDLDVAGDVEIDGGLGVGKEPAYPLEVSKSNTGNYVARFDNTGTATGDDGVQIDCSGSNDATSILKCSVNNDARFEIFSGSNVMAVQGNVDINGAATIDNAAGGTIALNTGTNAGGSFTNALRHTHASDPWGLNISYTVASPSASTGNYYILCEDATASRFYVAGNGGIYNYQSNDSDLSDQRMKTDLTPLESVLERFVQIPIGTWAYLDNLDHIHIGSMAQDVEKHFPEVIKDTFLVNKGTENEFMAKGINNKGLLFIAMKAIQELNTKHESELAKKDVQIEAILARLTALEGEKI